MLKLWEQFLERFKLEISVDKENGYIYLRSFLWYTDAKLPEDRQLELEQLLDKYLSEDERGTLMRTIAQKYIESGKMLGIAQGIEKGKAEGKIEIVKRMLAKGSDPAFISTITGLDEDFILSLANSKTTYKSKL